jgi:putative ABC transport system substrate-binding protein
MSKYMLDLIVARRNSWSVLLLAALTVFLFVGRASAKESKILILNSDLSVEKYFIAQSEFKTKSNVRETKIDLGSEWADEGKLEARIKSENPDLIYCIGSKAYLLAHKLGGRRDIIFSSAINWQRLPLGENTYGVAMEIPSAMQMTTFRYLFPELRKIGVLYSKTYGTEWLKGASENAKEVGFELVPVLLKDSADLEQELRELLPNVDALWLTPDPIVISGKESVNKLFGTAGLFKKPVFAYDEVFANFGALMAITADIPTMGGQAAGLADEVLAREKVVERIQNPAGSSITLSLRKVDEYGIKLRPGALNSVNRLIR